MAEWVFCGQNEAEKYKHELEKILFCTQMDELQFHETIQGLQLFHSVSTSSFLHATTVIHSKYD